MISQKMCNSDVSLQNNIFDHNSSWNRLIINTDMIVYFSKEFSKKKS